MLCPENPPTNILEDGQDRSTKIESYIASILGLSVELYFMLLIYNLKNLKA
jgi:hypothetical protein